MSKNRNIGVTPETVSEDTEAVMNTAAVTDVPEEAPVADEKTVAVVYPDKLVYIGPTVFRTQLVSGRVFITGGMSIDEILTDDLRNYPLARTLFVKPEEAAAAMSKLNDPGTAIGNAYKRLSGR